MLVVGGGSAGCVASVAAAQLDAKTALVDRLPFLGGTSTAVLDTFYALYSSGPNAVRVVRGIAQDVLDRLTALQASFERPNSFGSGTGVTYDPEALKLVWDDLTSDSSVDVFTGAVAIAAGFDGGDPWVDVAVKGGVWHINAKVVVDASGDGDASLLLGARSLTDTLLTQPATLTFRMFNVDDAAAFGNARRPLHEYIEMAIAQGDPVPSISGSLHKTYPGAALVAMTSVPSPSPDDPRSWRRAERDARAQIPSCVRFLQKYVPGFGHATVGATGAMLGVRETRRIAGRHVLTEEEILQPLVPVDSIALCGAPIEDLSYQPTRWVHIPEPGIYGIPYGCLIPEGVPRVLVAGRCVSASHSAHSSARSMGTCMAMGQAAGTAAAIAARRGLDPWEVHPAELRDVLRSNGAIVDLAQCR